MPTGLSIPEQSILDSFGLSTHSSLQKLLLTDSKFGKKELSRVHGLLCDWCGTSYKKINRHRNFCKKKPSDIVHQ
jgi:hypothetical protein